MPAAGRLSTLAEIEAAIWRELERATLDREHGWRTPVLATIDAGAPDARVVILREVDAAARRLGVFSDARAAKIAQLAATPRATLVAWSPRLGWQLRLRLEVRVETEGLAVTSHWARVKLSPSARDYLSAIAPGAPLQAAGTPPHARQRNHFAVLQAQVLAIDWLELHRDGHRRAAFDADGARWLQP
jgi:pyridoxamine 5'-phosphate oxidase